MTQKLTYKGLAALAMVNIEVKVEEPKVESPKPVKMETYQPVEAKVPEVKPQGVVVDTKKLKMKPRFVQKGMTPIQMAIHKLEMKEAREQTEDKAWKAWAEASLKRHYSNEENHITVATPEEALAPRTKHYDNPVKL